MIRLTLSFTDLIEVLSFTEDFQHFSAAVFALRGCVISWYQTYAVNQKQKICGVYKETLIESF